MRQILIALLLVTVIAFGQKIETQRADHQKITRIATTQNHLTVLEFNEPVKEVAVGSSNFKIEWRENKVFVQPLEPNESTNLFVWTASGRQNYELVPAGSVGEMHFAIDEEPAPVAKQVPAAMPVKEDPPPPAPSSTELPKIPAAMLIEGTPVRSLAAARLGSRVRVDVRDVYEKGGLVFIRYVIVNGGKKAYVPATPDVFTLKSPRAPQSLVGLANIQLASDWHIESKEVRFVRLLHAEVPASPIEPGNAANGLISFALPPRTQPGERIVVKLLFPADAVGYVTAFLVL